MANRRNRSVHTTNLTRDDGKSPENISTIYPVGSQERKIIDNISACQAFNLEQRQKWTAYMRHLEKLQKTKANIWFTKKCVRLKVTPKFARITMRTNTEASRKAKKKAEIEFLKCETRALYAKKEQLNAKLLAIHLELAPQFPTGILMDGLHQIRTKIAENMTEKYVKLNKKLDKLTGRKDRQKTEHKFHDRFVNLTKVDINEDEAKILEKGLKYNLHEQSKRKEIEQIIVDSEIAISLIPNDEQDKARHICRQIIDKEAKRNKRQDKESRTVKELGRKLRLNNVITTKADKGNTTVLINKDEYVEKTKQLIEDTKCRRIIKDPTDEYQTKIKQTIKTAPKIIKPEIIYRLTQMNPSAPPMIALPKIHKPNIPMRPIINYKSAPNYKLSKYLKTVIETNINLENKYTIANTTELIDKLKNIEVTNDTKLVSFDIKDLYPSIPVTETINIVHKELISRTKDTEFSKQLTYTLKTTLEQNYFKFNNNIYKQPNGLGMGNPTSAILMEVFMQSLEEKYMEDLKSNFGVKFYARYVDDIICIIGNSNEEQILNHLNTQHKNITFTMEKEEDNRINYLDLTIKTDKILNKLEYEIYRKPTATDTIIHNSSNHPHQHKNSAIRHLITRLERTPLSKEAYNKELGTIYNITTNNGYSRGYVDKIRRDIQTTKKHNKVDENDRKTWTTLTYMGTSTYKLAKVFRNYNISTAFKTKNNLGRILKTNTNEEDYLDKQGIYKLTCTCEHSYIGQTGRKLKTRFREHIRDYNRRLKQPETITESNFANHMFNNKCRPTHVRETIKLLHTQNKGRRLNVLENMEIYKQKTFDGRIINEQINTCSDTIFEPLKYFYRKQKDKTVNLNCTGKQNISISTHKRTITDYYTTQEKGQSTWQVETDNTHYTQHQSKTH